MADGEVPIAAAGGLDDSCHTLGTDAMRIFQAIETVYSGDGVLVFADMGSALLSAELAVQMLDEQKQPHVIISDAPFVEGAVCAAVQARINAPLTAVLNELQLSLLPKQEHLGTTSGKTNHSDTAPAEYTIPADGLPTENQPVQCLHVTVHNTHGIHARPAAKIAALAGAYPYLTVTMQKKDSPSPAVSAVSLNAIALLNIKKDDIITFFIAGNNSEAFCAELTALAADHFGDEEPETGNSTVAAPSPAAGHAPAQKDSTKQLSGLTGSEGIAIGTAVRLKKTKLTVPDTAADSPDAEWEAFLTARNSLQQEIDSLAQTFSAKAAQTLSTKTDNSAADIFHAHSMILQDPVLTEAVKSELHTNKTTAAQAWLHAIQPLKQAYTESPSPYMQERAGDIEELEQSLLAKLLHTGTALSIDREGIIIAEDLSPRQTASLDTSLIQGICTARGSPTSHTAILARSLGIPAVMGMGESLLSIEEGTNLILDAEKGILHITPEQEAYTRYAAAIEAKKQSEESLQQYKHEAARMQNGKTVIVAANTGTAQTAKAAVENGADGIGLLRTEFLFLNRSKPPTEDEQYRAYCETAEIMQGKPVIIRSLDAGGDKELPYLALPKDENPFLGCRAVRISLAQPEFFRAQLRAVIRTAQEYPIKLLIPMISSMQELAAVKEQVNTAYAELEKRTGQVQKRMPLGMMIEVPAAALQAEDFAKKVDFFSIGTNDLTQYTLAAERGNSRVAALYSPFHPAVLALIQKVIAAAHRENIPVGVCGEFASDFEGAALLCGYGIDLLSVNPPAIPRLKAFIRTLPVH